MSHWWEGRETGLYIGDNNRSRDLKENGAEGLICFDFTVGNRTQGPVHGLQGLWHLDTVLGQTV